MGAGASSAAASLPSTAPTPSELSNWPLFPAAQSTPAVSFADTPLTTTPSTTPASLLSSLSTPLLDSYGSQQLSCSSASSSFAQQQEQQLQQQPLLDIFDWSSILTMPYADPIMFPPSRLGMASHHHSPSSSVGATMATSTATQSRTPPLSLSPAYSSETSPVAQAADGGCSASVAVGEDNDNDNNSSSSSSSSNNLQFLSFLDLSSLGSTPGSTAEPAASVAMAPSVSSSSASGTSVSAVAAPSPPPRSSLSSSSSSAPNVPGLTLSRAARGVHKRSGAGGARVRTSTTTAAADDEDLLLKRQRNSLAARKYRQKKLDRISELEVEVGQLQGERDALRIQLARQEAETTALRKMLLVQSRDREDDGGSKRRKRK
ncbi:hypothetical protein SPBR_08446 [Sporothrix brasiliensis 5110]|uniref:BZIP domain-containing protein n=1 Tax=Sporothrix brasiliensis 5110 TaxID=1398154 RepID=A0A0C2ELB7_9PEZI|nr:uncharacterized protein SPBR_08446 [Sporothrix brasiliensis 5110]KIH86889.1 hypothetical protein SPBR_08446 [Sporothrix brasiliensis 5110]